MIASAEITFRARNVDFGACVEPTRTRDVVFLATAMELAARRHAPT
jgi:hypothetical protein